MVARIEHTNAFLKNEKLGTKELSPLLLEQIRLAQRSLTRVKAAEAVEAIMNHI
jgi:hypothetical protein